MLAEFHTKKLKKRLDATARQTNILNRRPKFEATEKLVCIVRLKVGRLKDEPKHTSTLVQESLFCGGQRFKMRCPLSCY